MLNVTLPVLTNSMTYLGAFAASGFVTPGMHLRQLAKPGFLAHGFTWAQYLACTVVWLTTGR
jgi:hypothetical protein